MERQIDLSRDRHMLCGICAHQWLADLEWIDRWEQGREVCPGCGTTCEHENAPRVTVDPDDLALDDDKIAQIAWYHTSTLPDWPAKDFDPAADLTAETQRMMGGSKQVAAWAARQRGKALHVGTYESAIHNMLRRMHDQADHDSQFYLYRVLLTPSVAVREGWLFDPGDFLGDVALDEICPPGVDVARYLNYHEDPGGLSLALGRGAVASVQQVAVPLRDACDNDWVREAVADLDDSSDALVPATGRLGRFMPPSSPRASLGRELGAALAGKLPINLQDQFISAAAFDEGDNPVRWARRTSCLFDLIVDPLRALAELDRQERRTV